MTSCHMVVETVVPESIPLTSSRLEQHTIVKNTIVTLQSGHKRPGHGPCLDQTAASNLSADAGVGADADVAIAMETEPTDSSLSSLLRSYTAHELAQAHLILKPVRLYPSVYVVRTASQSELACCLLLEDMEKSACGATGHAAYSLSFDTETTVTRKTHPGAPSVIQLATPNLCVLFQVYAFIRWSDEPNSRSLPLHFPMRLKAMLESPHLIKYGLGACMDAQALCSSYGIAPRSILELQQLNDGLGLPKSLAKYTALYSTSSAYQSKTLMKKHVWRDHLKRYWERTELNMEEIDYASKDVFAVISAFRNFIRTEQPHILSIQNELDVIKQAKEQAKAKALEEKLNKQLQA